MGNGAGDAQVQVPKGQFNVVWWRQLNMDHGPCGMIVMARAGGVNVMLTNTSLRCVSVCLWSLCSLTDWRGLRSAVVNDLTPVFYMTKGRCCVHNSPLSTRL